MKTMLKAKRMLNVLISIFVSCFIFSASVVDAAEPFGTPLGDFNGVNVYSNCDDDCAECNNYCQDLNYIDETYIGIKWQCVEYVRRYYFMVYGLDLASKWRGDANTWYNNAITMGLDRYANSDSTKPQVGDILISEGIPGDNVGHIAIIKSVFDDSICTIQQNFSNDSNDIDRCLTLTVSNGNYTVGGFSSNYPIRGWIRVKSRRFIPYQTIYNVCPTHSEVFTIDGEIYLAELNGLGLYHGKTDIYKWNGFEFTIFQYIKTEEARDAESFKINGETYLSITGRWEESIIFKWNGDRFAEYQIIDTYDSYGCESFVIGGESYLVIADCINPQSVIYKWNGFEFTAFQIIDSKQTMDWKSFTIAGEIYLAAAVNAGGGSDSMIYKWNGSVFAEFQSIDVYSAWDWESFIINEEIYLAAAVYRDGTTYNTDSKIYKWSGNSFIEFQAIPTNAAMDWESFIIDGEMYLAVANHFNGSTAILNSKIYKWNGNSFAEFQAIQTNYAYGWESFIINETAYLMVADRNGANSKIYIISNEIVVCEEELAIQLNETVDIPVVIPEHCAQSTIARVIEGSDVEMSLTSPSGDVINRQTDDSSISHVLTGGNIFEAYNITDPAFGEWIVRLEGADVPAEGESVGLTVSVDISGIADTIPPEITVTASPNVLWPPNHKMVDVNFTVEVSDNCDEYPNIALASVVSNEPDNGKSDGNTINDIQNADIGTEDYNISLRAERSGKGDGRIYIITYTATDASGNSASASAIVEVSHDSRK